jgi:hypothetical protein
MWTKEPLTMSIPTRDELLDTLRGLLTDAFALHQKGALGARLGRSHGMADGYMRALLDIGIASKKELTRIVAEERAKKLGPATQTLAPEAAESDTLAA